MQDNLFRVVITHEVTGREQIDAGHFEFGRSQRADIAADTEIGEVCGAYLGHFKKRGDQSVGNTPMSDAFTYGIDSRVEGLHGVIDDDASVAMDTRLCRQGEVRADADRHDDEIGRYLLTALEAYCFHSA